LEIFIFIFGATAVHSIGLVSGISHAANSPFFEDLRTGATVTTLWAILLALFCGTRLCIRLDNALSILIFPRKNGQG
jgi:hypothetical protein